MKACCFIILVLFISSLNAQTTDDPFDQLGDWDDTQSMAIKTFRSTKIVNMPSVEIPYQGELIFNIGHRFGNIRSGIYQMFGLDLATIRLGFDYGINPWLGAGVGRSTFEKTYDAYLKFRIVTQEGRTNSSVSLNYYISASQATVRDFYPPGKDNFSGRLNLVQSLMLSRKFSENISLQLNPIFLRSNYLTEIQGPANNLFMGFATRIRLTPMTHLNMEYIFEMVDSGVDNTNPLSLGFDIETGGHVFQLFFSNTQGIFDKAYLVNTNGSWQDGDIFFGFTITRIFYL